MNKCTDCRHFASGWCHKLDSWKDTRNAVTGEIRRLNHSPYKRAENMRRNGPCGMEGRLWEPKMMKRFWRWLRG